MWHANPHVASFPHAAASLSIALRKASCRWSLQLAELVIQIAQNGLRQVEQVVLEHVMQQQHFNAIGHMHDESQLLLQVWRLGQLFAPRVGA